MNVLKLALRDIKAKNPDPKAEAEGPDELEAAMDDFQNATTASERAAAFRAALELSKSE